MQMVDGLSAIIPAVQYGAESLLRKTHRFCGLLHGRERTAQKSDIGDIQNRIVVRFWNQENMNWGLRMHVTEGDKLLIFKDKLCWYGPGPNFTEDTVGFHILYTKTITL